MESPPAGAGAKRDRWVPALILFLPMALWPAVAAAASWSAGEMPSFFLALIGVVLAALPSTAVALGLSWARKLAEAFALAGMVIGILFVLRNGISLLAVPSVGYLVVYAFLSHERFRAEDKAAAPAEPHPAEHPMAWVKENVEAIAVAFIMALVIRCFCVEVFKIPSSSMEPTLLGDAKERGGDRIMVTKLSYFLQKPKRFECAVFKFPGNPMKNFIKRIVGLPDEEFVLYRGNVYARPGKDGPGDFMIQRKPLRTQRSLWIPAWVRDGSPLLQSKATFEGHFIQERGRTPTLLDGVLSGDGQGRVSWRNKAEITDGYLGGPMGHSPAIVNDVLFDASLTLQGGPGRFWIRVQHDFGSFELSLSPAGDSALRLEDKPTALKTASFPAGKSVHVEFMVYDGQAVVLFDGREQAELVFQRTLQEVEAKPYRGGNVEFGADGVSFSLANLRVGQDIHYKPKDDPLSREQPLAIPPGNYFMLGDNVNNSHDGRAWKKYTLTLDTGEKVEFESQASKPELKQSWADRHGKDAWPDFYIDADFRGHERGIYRKDLAPNGESRAADFSFVEERYIIGRALAVCWPLSRSFKLIR